MNKVIENKRVIEVIEEVEVLVVGGGPAGLGAAIASARTGSETLLLERYGHLGGMATGGLVILIGPYTDNKTEVLGGIAREIIDRTIKNNYGVWDKKYRGYATVDPEGLKHISNQMVIESGAKILLHVLGTTTLMENNIVKGVIVECKKGPKAILAKRIIDTTGDGDISISAGCEFREESHPWGVSLVCRIGNVNFKKFLAFKEREIEKWNELKIQMDNNGFATNWLQALYDGVFWFDGSFIKNKDALDPVDLTEIEIKSRENIFKAIDFYKDNLPGFENCFLIDTGSQLGIRETRRILGEYKLTTSDIENSKNFEDKVFVGSTELDPRVRYYMPYRCLIPKNIENLFVAGRCISCTHNALNLIRTISPCIAMGQAAGTAAALSIKNNVSPRRLNGLILRNKLKKEGVLID